ncbi:MAG: hypothetical protein QXG05_00540 [Nitrososphaerota archaeon]
MKTLISATELSTALSDAELYVTGRGSTELHQLATQWQLPNPVRSEILRIANMLKNFRVSEDRRGKFIAFSGLDKTGKETQLFNPHRRRDILSITQFLSSSGYRVLGIKQPSYDTLMGKLVATYLGRTTEFRIEGSLSSQFAWILWSLDRAQHNKSISEWLSADSKNIVLAKRWTDSNVIYQAANGVEPDRVLKMESNIVKPDAIVVLDAPVDVVMKRMKLADAYEESAFLTRVKDLYDKLERFYPYCEIYRVDASVEPSKVNVYLLTLIKKILQE